VASLTTLAAVKQALNIPTADTGYDALIAALILQVDDLARRLTGYTLTAIEDGIYYPVANDSLSVELPEAPVVTINNVWVSTDTPRVYTTATKLTVDTDVILERGVLLTRVDGGYFPAGPKTVKVDYDSGFSTIPADLARAAIEVIAVKMEKGIGRLYHISGVSRGDGSLAVVHGSDVPHTAADVFQKYARKVLW
jgi:hypothetical protein